MAIRGAPVVVTNYDQFPGGGGGGGGGVTVADGADVAQGTRNEAAWSGTGNGTVISILKALFAKAYTPVAIDQSNDGTTNKTNITASLRASGTHTKANVTSATSSTTLLASNANRKGAIIWNDSSAILYVDLTGGTASATSCTTPVAAGGVYEVPYGLSTAITGIWVSANGAARVTEIL